MNIDKRKIEQLLRDFGVPVLMVVSGLILLLNPDGATALVTKLLGWCLVIGCAARLISLATGNRLHWGMDAFLTGAVLCVGVVLLSKPLILANLIGRVLGMVIVLEGIDRLRRTGPGPAAILTIAAGVVLILMPRTLTQTVLGICGIVLMVLGVLNILGKVSQFKRLEEHSDPNIIDADM